MDLPNYDGWKLDNPYNDERDEEPTSLFDVDGVVILDKQCHNGQWVYLVADENGGPAAWIGEGEVSRG